MDKRYLIVEQDVDLKKIAETGNRFLIGNMHLGIRGTLDEYTKEQMVGLNLPFVYDKNKDQWREPVNAPNPLYFLIKVNGHPAHVLHNYTRHEQTLDISCGLFSRKTMFVINDIELTFSSQRFVSEQNPRMIYVQYRLETNRQANIEILTGIDGDIWDLNGPHLTPYTMDTSQQTLHLQTKTIEKKQHIEVYESLKMAFETNTEYVKDDCHLYRKVLFTTKPSQTYVMEKYARIAIDEETSDQTFQKLCHLSFGQALDKHQHIWRDKWQHAEVVIDGDDQADKALHYSIYHLLMLTPYNHQSIPARGVSGQTYKGAVFWDTEMFMLPFFLNVNPEAAKHLIQYRIDSLNRAKEKASLYGYQGAFYAWESQEKGVEACTDYNVVDVFTNRPVRTYFKDKQIHISADIVYGLWQYYLRTKNIDILLHGGADVILACAMFYYDRSYWHLRKKRAEYLDVLGPDEYHERVHNNAFTNRMIKFVFAVLAKTNDLLSSFPNIYKVWSKQANPSIHELILFGQTIYLKKPLQSGIIEQFDGYLNHLDIPLEDLLSKRIKANEYLGGHGLAGDTQIIKQADVIAMLYLFYSEFDYQVLKANFEYYHSRTEHGSSLSASMYALVACMIKRPDIAYPLFMKSATVDLSGDSKTYAGHIYIGGTHPAAAGGAYLTAIYGFAGLKISKDGKITCKPQLPQSIKRISFRVVVFKQRYHITVTKQKATIIKEIES